MLDTASYGAYAMDRHRKILFWNRSAERILGHKAKQVVGRQCYEALFGLSEQSAVPTCTESCLAVRLAAAERVAPVAQVRMRCASGGWKRVGVMVLTVPDGQADSSILVHLFYEQVGGARTRSNTVAPVDAIPRSRMDSPHPRILGRGESLTPRELEVVRLLTAGEGIESIGQFLHVSTHTVLNHVRNAREKLHARTRLDLVLAAQRHGFV